jgi:formate/nitrite transporter FocA (FNT family)
VTSEGAVLWPWQGADCAKYLFFHALQLSPNYRAANPGMFNLLFGAFGMPMGLALCLINGASLFTSNVAYMGAATLERKASCLRSFQLLLVSLFTNIAGKLPSCFVAKTHAQTVFKVTGKQMLLLDANTSCTSM